MAKLSSKKRLKFTIPKGLVYLWKTWIWHFSKLQTIWAVSWQYQQNDMCAQRRLRSALASAQSDQSLRFRPVWTVFAVRMKKPWVLIYPLRAKRRLWSEWADAQADVSLRWAHSHFVGFVMRRLILKIPNLGLKQCMGKYWHLWLLLSFPNNLGVYLRFRCLQFISRIRFCMSWLKYN